MSYAALDETQVMHYLGDTPLALRGLLRIKLRIKRRNYVEKFLTDRVQSIQNSFHKAICGTSKLKQFESNPGVPARAARVE
jgi:hypothetical protein